MHFPNDTYLLPVVILISLAIRKGSRSQVS